MTSPEPVPAPAAPLALIVTTDGSTSLATEVTAQALAEPVAAVLVMVLEPLDVQPAPTTARAGIRIQGHLGRRRPAPSVGLVVVTGPPPCPSRAPARPIADPSLLAPAFTWRRRRASPGTGETSAAAGPGPTAIPHSSPPTALRSPGWSPGW